MVQPTDRPASETAIKDIRNLSELKQGANLQSGRAVNALFNWIYERNINEIETTEEDISEAFEDNAEYRNVRWIDILRLISDTEDKRRLGRFVVGRHNHKTRVVWHGEGAVDIACRILGKEERSPSSESNGTVQLTSNLNKRRSNAVSGGRIGAYTLKVGRIEVLLPRDAAPEEYAELIALLERLKR